MNIHEHQAKAVLKEFGVAVPRGFAAFTVEEAVKAATELGGPVFVVKSQIHAGGRGKGRFEGLGPDAKGGVRVVKSVEDVRTNAAEMLGRVLVTHQTGPKGKQVNRLYIEEGAQIAKEFYLSLLVDRETSRVSVVASTEGGMDIEEVAAHQPEKILKEWCDPLLGLADYQARNLAFGLGLSGASVQKCVGFMRSLYRAYVDLDCSLLEVNPLVVTSKGELIALDAKVNFDDNAMFRHPEFSALRDLDEEDPKEIAASKYDLSYISLDGDIGCMVNGAGLAMSTMDIIKHFGGEPSNFLDVGGGATTEKVTAGFEIILTDPNVKGIFVNIFGGIMKCDTIAHGVIAATRKLGLKVPVVVRLEGTNVELGKALLLESGLNLQTADDMADGAQKIVAAVAAGRA